MASVLVNRIGEGSSSLVTNHGFLPEAFHTVISLRTTNLNGGLNRKVTDPREIFFFFCKGGEKCYSGVWEKEERDVLHHKVEEASFIV